MKRLRTPKEAKKTMSVWDQMKIALACYALGLLFSTVTSQSHYQTLGHICYWGIFLIKPVVPWNVADDPDKSKKYKLSMRVTSAIMILYPLNEILL